MTHTTRATVHDIATLQGVMLHGATPFVFRSGPYVTGDAGTEDIQDHYAMIMPYELAGTALSQSPVDGRYSLLGFFNTFLQSALASRQAKGS
jgi:hypothetical protein